MPFDPAAIDKDQLSEVYGRLGMALYAAQHFEMTLGNFFLIHYRITDPTMATPELEAKLAAIEDKQTLGLIIKEFRKLVDVSPEYESVLNNALAKRNWLVHRFFRDRGTYFLSSGGRDKLIEELIDIFNDFTRARVVVEAMHDAMSRLFGVTNELLAEEWAKLEAQAELLDAKCEPDQSKPHTGRDDNDRASA